MMRAGEDGMSRKTPYFVMHKEKLIENLKRLKKIDSYADVYILHTLKSFNEPSVLPTIATALSGMSISSKQELLLAKDAKAHHIHLYAPAFKPYEIETMHQSIDTLSFNSLRQYETFSKLNVSKGIRINPKLHLLIPSYCNPNISSSRLGVDFEEFLHQYSKNRIKFKDLEGLHFHALFQSLEQGVVLLLEHILTHYKDILPQLKWINLGGGHNFTDLNYNIDNFCKGIDYFKSQYPNIQLYFEPGESVTKGCGEFVTTVLDIVKVDNKKIAILDTSIETHLLDVAIAGIPLKVKSTTPHQTPYFYELAGNSCIQGDLIGEYFFQEELHIGSKIIFEDMMSYTLVKMTQFNGMQKANFYLN